MSLNEQQQKQQPSIDNEITPYNLNRQSDSHPISDVNESPIIERNSPSKSEIYFEQMRRPTD